MEEEKRIAEEAEAEEQRRKQAERLRLEEEERVRVEQEETERLRLEEEGKAHIAEEAKVEELFYRAEDQNSEAKETVSVEVEEEKKGECLNVFRRSAFGPSRSDL